MDEDRIIEPASADPQTVAAEAKAAIVAKALTQAEVAPQIGVSPSAFSAFLAGRYKGDNGELARKLRVWLDRQDASDWLRLTVERLAAPVETPIFTAITAKCDLAKMLPCIVGIAGQPGVGKTKALTAYAARVPGTFYCEFSKDQSSIFATLKQIAHAIGLSDLPRAPDDLREAIQTRLTRTRALLICDEAQNMSRDGLEQVRTIFDRLGKTEAPIGVVFAGHPDLMDKVGRMDQLDGRFGASLRIASASAADADALFDAWGLEDAGSRKFLRAHAGHRTGLRRIANVYRLAAIRAAGDGAPVQTDHMKSAWAALNDAML